MHSLGYFKHGRELVYDGLDDPAARRPRETAVAVLEPVGADAMLG